MRALWVVNAADDTSVAATIAAGIAKRTDIDIELLAWFGADEFDGDEHVTVTDLDAPDGLGIDVETLSRVRERVRAHDLVQTHHPHSAGIVAHIATATATPLISHVSNQRRGFTTAGQWANRVTNLLADRVIPNSGGVLTSFGRVEQAMLDGRVRLIPTGVDCDQVRRNARTATAPVVNHLPDDVVTVASVGALSKQKNHETLLRAVARSNQRASAPLNLIIAGGGDRRELRTLAESLGISKRVTLTGELPNRVAHALMAAADIYAMPSRWEGCSLASLEAAATGTACVFADIEPFRWTFADRAVYHPPESHDALAATLTELCDHEQQRQTLGSSVQKWVERHYNMPDIVDRYVRVYRELVDVPIAIDRDSVSTEV